MVLSAPVCPPLLALALAAVTLLCLSGEGGAQLLSDDPVLPPPSRRSFLGLNCRGVFDKVIFRDLNAVCQECYGLYKDPELHGLCRSECFTSEYFKGCLQALRREHEAEKFDLAIRRTSGKKKSHYPSSLDAN